MKYLKLWIALLFCFLLIYSCQDSVIVRSKGQKKLDSIKKENKNPFLKADTSGFFNNCQQLLMNGISVGDLQGTNHSIDSIENLGFLNNYDSTSFEIICLLKGGIKKRTVLDGLEISEMLKTGCQNYFNYFDCFAFVYPHRDPQKQEDIHSMNIDFPVVVRIYKRIENDNWEYMETVKEKTFEGFSELQFETIYSK